MSRTLRPFLMDRKIFGEGKNVLFAVYQAMLSVAQNINRMVNEYSTRKDMEDAVVSYSSRICVM
jgi:hypothetical protein